MVELITYGMGILMAIGIWGMGFLANPEASAQGASQEGYPPPNGDTIEPAATLEIMPLATPQPYPPGGVGFDQPTPIGAGIPAAGQSFQEGVNNSPAAETRSAQDAGGGSLLFLWVSFLATLLILIVSVIGATLLFTRRNES